MKDIKKCFRDFNMYNRAGYERFFEEQAEEGWMLEKSTEIFWVFRREKPKKVRYSVTYLKDVSVFDPQLTDSQLTLNEFCERTGWEFVTSNGHMQVFRTTEADPLPIETDPRMEIESFHASVKKGALPVYLLLAVLSVINIIVNLFSLFLTPINLIRYGNRLIAAFASGAALGLLLYKLIAYYVRRRRTLKEAELTGTYYEVPKRENTMLWYCLFTFAAMSASLSCLGVRVLGVLGICLAVIAGSIGIALCISLFKKKNVRARITKLVTVCLVIASCAGVLIPVCSSFANDVRTEKTPVEIVSFNGLTQYVYSDEIPLKVEDLIETDCSGYSYFNNRNYASFLGREYGARQRWVPSGDSGNPELEYVVYDLTFPFTRGLIVKTLLINLKECLDYQLPEGETEESWLSADPEPWGAEKVYQMRLYDGTWLNHWLICYSDKIVDICFDFEEEPTPEQMKTVTEKLL